MFPDKSAVFLTNFAKTRFINFVMLILFPAVLPLSCLTQKIDNYRYLLYRANFLVVVMLLLAVKTITLYFYIFFCYNILQGGVSLSRLLSLDTKLFYFINQRCNCRLLDILMVRLTHMGGLLFTLLLFLSSIFLLPQVPWYNLLAALVFAQIAVMAIKHVVARIRPYIALPQSRFFPKLALIDYSFPSGHSATAAAWATVLTYCLPGLWPIFVLGAIGVGFSRIYLGMHYPTDVLVGLLLGFLSGCLANFIF